jgi:DNA-binding transcriptional regulator YiaG
MMMSPTKTVSADDQLDVRTIRHALDLDRLQLAHALGVSQRTIYRWEDGESDLHPIWQDRLIHLFKQRYPRKTVPLMSMRDEATL